MGHIVNATATRIGKSTIWCDQWYSEILYYTEYLHAMFRIRFYCLYIFGKRHFDKKAIFYSHFEILKRYKTLFVEIYYYDGKLETDYEDFKFEFFIKTYYMDFNRDPETRIPQFLHTSMRILILWKFIHWFDLKGWNSSEIGSFAYILRKHKFTQFQYFFFKKFSKGRIYDNFDLTTLLFISIYIQMKISIGKWSIWKSPRRSTILRRVYMVAVALAEIDRFIVPIASILGYIFGKLIKVFKVKVYFYLTNNNCVNAKFLSRFIARKLKQKYPIKQLLNPIRKELLTVLKMSSTPVRSYMRNVDKKYECGFWNKQIYYQTFKGLFHLLTLIYNKNLIDYFKKTKTWFNFDYLIVYIYFNKTLDDIFELIDTSYQYFYTKYAYLCFFEYKFNLKIGKYIYLPRLNLKNRFLRKWKYSGFIDIILDSLYVSRNSFIKFNRKRYLSSFSINSFRSVNVHLNRYLTLNYWNYYYGHFSDIYQTNNLKSRLKEHTTSNNIKGYKMHLRGRFTRKQRASSYWFSYGKVPLNTLRTFIDFAFFTIALPNSSITVKVWLYKSSDMYNTFYYRLN